MKNFLFLTLLTLIAPRFANAAMEELAFSCDLFQPNGPYHSVVRDAKAKLFLKIDSRASKPSKISLRLTGKSRSSTEYAGGNQTGNDYTLVIDLASGWATLEGPLGFVRCLPAK